MKTKLFLIAAAGIVLLANSGHCEEGTSAELSNTKSASVTLKIITDPKLFVMDGDLSNIMNYFDLGRVYGAGNQVLGGSRTSWYKGIEVIEGPKEIGGMQVAKIGWEVNLSEQDKPAAREVALAVIQMVRGRLMKEFDENLGIFQSRLIVQTRRVDDAKMCLENLIRQQNNLGDGLMDAQATRQRMTEREKARIENHMQQAIVKKRAEELAKTLDQLKAEADRLKTDLPYGFVPGANGDEIRKSIEEQVNRKNMPMLGKEEIEEINKRFGSMKEAFADRERHRQLADEIVRLSSQHRETLLELEEMKIREMILTGWWPGSLSDSLKYEMLEVQIDAAKENLRRALIEKEQLVTEMDLIRPPVLVESSIFVSYADQDAPAEPGQ